MAAAVLSFCFPGTASLAQDIAAPAEHTRTLTGHLKGATRYHVAPDEDAIPNDKYGDDVRLGKKIFTETYKYGRRYAGNGLACANCHQKMEPNKKLTLALFKKLR